MHGDYRAARERHARLRQEAYEAARVEAVRDGRVDGGLWIADIDADALRCWEKTWARRRHRIGAGGWDWPRLLDRMPRRAATLALAFWCGDDLCGLALGYASRSRASGRRHTVVLTYVERRPEPPPTALRGRIVDLAVAVAEGYGTLVGASRLRLRSPDRNLLPFYESMGFHVVRVGIKAAYCERRI